MEPMDPPLDPPLLGVPSKVDLHDNREEFLHSILRLSLSGLPNSTLCKKSLLSRLDAHTDNPKSWISVSMAQLNKVIITLVKIRGVACETLTLSSTLAWLL